MANAKDKLTKARQAIICLMLSLALAFSMTPAYALDNEQDSPDTSGESAVSDALEAGDKVVVDGEEVVIDGIEDHQIKNIDDQAVMSLFSNGEDSPQAVSLKDTNETSWFDRIAFPDQFRVMCTLFYRILEEGSDNDGNKDYLIDEKYISTTFNTPDVANEFVTFAQGFTSLCVGSFKYSTYDEYLETREILSACYLAVLSAFDRDHPEVFWISGTTRSFWTTSSNVDGNGQRQATLYLAIGGYKNLNASSEQDSIRSDIFGSEDVIKRAIAIREERVQELLADVGVIYPILDSTLQYSESASAASVIEVADVNYSDSEKVRFFNKWLTYANGYNTQDLNTLPDEYPLAFECLSALVGKSGEEGPVCEGYSRAMKVLCDAAGIDCVLVDGLAQGGAHMWNSVRIGNTWYGLDSTWNDPGLGYLSRSGFENENYLLVGSKTVMGSQYFDQSHITQNQVYTTSLMFLNDPVLSEQRYVFPEGSNDFADYDKIEEPPIDLDFLYSDLSHAHVSAIPNATYTTQQIRPSFTVTFDGATLVAGRDYLVSYGQNVNVGTGTVQIIGFGEFTGQKTVTFQILPATISVISVTIANKIYTGSALKPTPVVKVSNSNFKKGVHYVVETTYSNNKNAGLATANVVIRGIGNCTGAYLRTVTFKISPKKYALKKLTAKKKSFVAKWTKSKTATCTGYQLRYSLKKTFKSGVKTVTIKSISKTQTTVKKLKSKRRYYVGIRIYKTYKGVKYYGAWSATKSIRTK